MTIEEDTNIKGSHSDDNFSPVGVNPCNKSKNENINRNQTPILNQNVKNSPTSLKKLPKFFLCNIQSFGSSEKTEKTTETEIVLEKNNIDVGIFTETWLSDITKDQIHFKNYITFHSIRENVLRASGGVSILVKCNIPSSKIDVKVPEHLECLWVSVRPKWLPRTISNIVVCGVYYPGSSSIYAPRQEDIILHITATVHQLYKRYSSPLFVVMGDFNDLKVDEICDACKLKQVVKIPTRKQATLDLILTNENNILYNDPVTLPSIGGSDHLCLLYEPILYENSRTSKKKVFIRKFRKSAIIEFGSWITNFKWTELLMITDVNLKISYFTNIMWIMIDKHFPLVGVMSASDDKEWITSKIKNLISERQKAHQSKNYDARDVLAKKIKEEIKKAKVSYHKAKAENFTSSNAKEWYRHISKIINNGKRKDIIFNNVPELVDKTIDEIIDIVNNHFAKICQTYPAFENSNLINVDPEELDIKPITELLTYKLLKKFAKKALGPGDFPKQILQEFAAELAIPFCDITNCSIKSGIFPEQYKISEIIPIPKENPPKALKDLRPISKTAVGGKIIEKVMVSELENDTKETFNDFTQYGNSRGCSTTHYLVKLTDEAYKSTDVGQATTAITIDYSKAFDLVDHTILIGKLMQLGVRVKLIKLIISFLSNRSHYTKIKGITSKLTKITCGVPQGTISGPRFFTILIKDVKCPVVSNYKFVDDKTLAFSYSGDPTEFLQQVLDVEVTETEKDKMIINESKCNVITFNFSKKNICPQGLTLNGNPLSQCDKIKLLGVIISEDLKWSENTDLICSNVNKRFFILSKLKQFGLKEDDLLKAWTVVIRPVVEYAAPLWHSGLTAMDSQNLESLQKKALGLILGTVYEENRRYYKVRGEAVSYELALKYCELTTLKHRREILISKFALETAKNERHKTFFEEKVKIGAQTRNTKVIQEISCKTERYFKSAIPYMARILNGVNLDNPNKYI